MKTQQIIMTMIIAILPFGLVLPAQAGPDFQKCVSQCLETPRSASNVSPKPMCGLELTCTDRPVVLSYYHGVCLRATCPGIWGLLHTRVDQASFKRRFFTYRHFTFRGEWELKDQGVIEAKITPVRELFLVLPGDLIEFRLTEPDCKAIVEIKKLGYIKTGNLKELVDWLEYNSYMEKARLKGSSQLLP